MVTLVCDHCGGAFERDFKEVSKRAKRGITHTFCGRQCAYASPLRRATIGLARVQQTSDIRTLQPHEAGYIAGIIDGEGTVTLYKVGSRGRFQYNCCITVVNTDVRILDFCYAKTGIGFVKEASGNETRPHNHLAQYRWDVTKRADIVGLIDAVRPFLVSKHLVADAMREFCVRRVAGEPITEVDERLCEATKRRVKT